MPVQEIQSAQQFDSIVSSLPPTQLLVVDFHAAWCGPCHAIAPVLKQLSGVYQHVKFVKIDVDQQRDLASRFRITAMPTFKFLKAGREVEQLRGASPPQLQQIIARHAGVPPPAGSASSTTTGEVTESLLRHVISKGLNCLNESKTHPLSSILGPDRGPRGTSFLESDVDPELLISIPFQDPIKLKHISIFSGISPSQAPKTIKLFINQPNIGFDEADSLTPAQEIELTADQVKGDKIELRFVRFQNVRSLHILVKDNQEDEETTRIDSIDLFGAASGDKAEATPQQSGAAPGGSMLERLMGQK
ncbi:thioredoxin [Cryptococcus wingfieldii CBS 7118]|uniref:Thioredoxin n=1 Tax=Cryptococcus wingfieldii CBS 7118 TaxID=1295528 RepID=A0A1E3J6N8_9TREE|nr:thioredoxin [Cryptococcus wingfieldii CBS 7118]ODN96527.1 thioredoxin [Cryptococcus wingfieldii CBS 7118]